MIGIGKAKESLEAARVCLRAKYFNSSTSRAYYAMFQVAQVALANAGFTRPEWSHSGLQSTFTNELTRRRKIYSKSLAVYLNRGLELRLMADYTEIDITHKQAANVLRWAENFINQVEEVLQGG